MSGYPRYMKHDRLEELAYWKNLMKEALVKIGAKEEQGKMVPLSREEAVRLLQVRLKTSKANV